MDVDRRRLIATAGLTAVTGLTMPGERMGIRLDSRTGDLARLTGALQALVDGYGSTPPAQTALRAWNLSRHVGVSARWDESPAAGRDWQALHARILVLEGNALIDSGDAGCGVRVLSHAESVAERIGDWPTIAHAHAVLAMAARGQGRWLDALRLAQTGQRYAGGAPVAVMLAIAQASAMAHLGDTVGVVAAIGWAQKRMDRLPPAAHGTTAAYSLDSYHPALFATMAASALVLARQTYAAAPFLSEARERLNDADSPGAGGLTTLLDIVAADSALNRLRPDIDEAEQHITSAVAASAGRPAAWLNAEVAQLARQAACHGADWSDLVELTSAWETSKERERPATEA
ncbi:hypothetical protein [Frankia sp. CiP3]|uniref:hypothetical protein n=1 Tax=Frankia sp. CiP3 TaxID=2880971 RepID=UPI001EF51340|nr:hypothetical protein [Frankia sp. CiP3]